MFKKENEIWDKNGNNMFLQFIDELEEYTKSGTLPETCSNDVKYHLELQNERLKNKNLRLQYDFSKRGVLLDEKYVWGKNWRDDRYENKLDWRSCELRRTVYYNNRKLYDKKRKRILYGYVTDVYNKKLVKNDLQGCPNCGAIIKISDLQKGCKYCGTKFLMEDLFPKITNYFHIEDFGSSQPEIKHEILKYILIVDAILYVIMDIYSSINPTFTLDTLRVILAGIIVGPILGYFTWASIKIAKIFVGAIKSVGQLANVHGSEKRFEKTMQKYTPEFSYTYFTSKAVSLLKMILLSQNPDDLVVYNGEILGNRFENIIDSSYRGGVALKKENIKDGICSVEVDIYMEDLYILGKRVKRKDSIYRVNLRRNVSKTLNMAFSIKAVECAGCGAGFDATREKKCTYCGRKYIAEEDDWVVTKVVKRS